MTMEMKKLNTNPFGLSEQSYNPIDLGRMKADAFNKKQGELTGHDCPKCLNCGRIAIAKRRWILRHRRSMRTSEPDKLRDTASL